MLKYDQRSEINGYSWFCNVAKRGLQWDASHVMVETGTFLRYFVGDVMKGMGEIMGGALLETEARTILNRGIEQGIEQGISQGISQGREELIMSALQNSSAEEIARILGIDISEVLSVQQRNEVQK